MGRFFRLLSVVMLGWGLSPSPRSFACNCATLTGSAKDHLPKAAAVFTGKVLAVRPHATWRNSVLLSVKEAWKGVGAREVVVWTYNTQGACGYPFEEGESYLVFAAPHPRFPGRLEVDLCGYTRTLRAAREELASLGPARPLSRPDMAPHRKPPPRTPPPLPEFQRRLAGRWERDGGVGRVDVEPTGQQTGILYLWRDRRNYLILPYRLRGQALEFPRVFVPGTAGGVEVDRIGFEHGRREMTWRLYAAPDSDGTTPPGVADVWKLKRAKPLPPALREEEDA